MVIGTTNIWGQIMDFAQNRAVYFSAGFWTEMAENRGWPRTSPRAVVDWKSQHMNIPTAPGTPYGSVFKDLSVQFYVHFGCTAC